MAKRPEPTRPGKPIKTTSRYRSAVTGRYVTRNHAKSHPKTTVRETAKRPGKSSRRKKK